LVDGFAVDHRCLWLVSESLTGEGLPVLSLGTGATSGRAGDAGGGGRGGHRLLVVVQSPAQLDLVAVCVLLVAVLHNGVDELGQVFLRGLGAG
jgi:hypothetical protein